MIVDLSDKVAIVTGAGQGIGEGIARVFAKAGAKIVIATRSRANGQSVADSIVKSGGVAWLNQTDVGRHAEVKRVVAETVERFGRLDIVVHNAASKCGINGLIRTAALEYARQNITVNGVEPGYILTPAMDALGGPEALAQMATQIPLGKLGLPTDIANTMLFLASDAAAYITGQTIVVDGGSTLPESPVVLEAFYQGQ